MFSSLREDWETPKAFYRELEKEFFFTLDPCADEQNKKCEKYYTKEQDGLSKTWNGERVFCNPPYGRKIGEWVRKCREEVQNGDCLCAVMLIPARTDTRWFHEEILGKAEIRFVKGRIKFGEAKENAPFPSMVVIFRKEDEK